METVRTKKLNKTLTQFSDDDDGRVDSAEIGFRAHTLGHPWLKLPKVRCK
jgi:hypothetical protein